MASVSNDMDTGEDGSNCEVFPLEGFGMPVFQMQCDMWKAGKLCDVTVVVGKRQIRANRFMLASESRYFQTLFTSEEYRDSTSPYIELKEVDPDAVASIIEAMYKRQVRISSGRCVDELLGASDRLQVDSVRTACCTFLQHQLDVTNCLYTLRVADMYNAPALKADAEKFIRQKLFADEGASAIQNKWFMLLSSEALLDLLVKDDLVVSNEEVLLDAVLEWAKSEPSERQHALPRLLAAVRLAHVPADVLRQKLAEPLIHDSKECLRLMVDALFYMQLPNCRAELEQMHHWPPRLSAKRLVRKHYCVKNFPGLAKRFHTDPFDDGRWRLLICPKGNGRDSQHLSVYLDAANSSSMKHGWSRKVDKCVFTVVNHKDERLHVVKETKHTFDSRESDWGFTEFVPLADILDSSKGYLVNDTLEIKVDIWEPHYNQP
eukprot:jgi/Chlat1/3104/Chrsp21S03336